MHASGRISLPPPGVPTKLRGARRTRSTPGSPTGRGPPPCRPPSTPAPPATPSVLRTSASRSDPSGAPSRGSQTTSTFGGAACSARAAASADSGTSSSATPRASSSRSSRMLQTAGTAVSSATSSSSARGPGRELDAAVLDAATRGHGDQPVPDARLLGPHASPGRPAPSAGCSTRSTTSLVSAPAPRTAAHGVGAHVAALGLRELEPGVPPRLVRTGERRQLAGVVREDQLDPQVVERAVDAEVGQRRPAELDPDEARREPFDGHHLDLVEDQRQLLTLLLSWSRS